MNKRNPFKDLKLDQEEKEITQAVESEKVRSVPGFVKLKRRYQQFAKYTLDKTRNINIRLSEKDLLKLKSKAIEEGIPYQTLVTSILHKYTNQ